MSTIFSLIDCNNFYASCERIFNPRLENIPIVILSNNDGCVIARSNEAKKLKIPMGAPYFQFKDFFVTQGVKFFSSNYELYGDMSNRVMETLKNLCPDIEIYSIDEAFLVLDGFTHLDLNSYACKIKETIRAHTGIPVSIGMSQSKTLAKIANHIAKKETKNGVINLCDKSLQEQILSRFPVDDIWGIGRQYSKKLIKMGIKTARDLRDVNIKDFRKIFSVVMEKTIQELRGIPCFQLEEIQPKKQIMSSRSFGKPVLLFAELKEAVAFHVTKAAEKLRAQNCRASGIYVFLHTNPFSVHKKQYSNSMTYMFPEHSLDTGYMISCAIKCLEKIFKLKYEYNKLGIMLLEIVSNNIYQQDLFHREKQKTSMKKEILMNIIDQTNKKMGKGTIKYATEGNTYGWAIKANYRSPRYTTCLAEVPQFFCK